MNLWYRIFIFLCFFYQSLLLASEEDLSWAHKTLKNMSLDEKLGQLFIVKTPHPSQATDKDIEELEALIQDYSIGGILYDLKGFVIPQIKQTNIFQRKSKYPLFVIQNLETGLGMKIKDGLRFPNNEALGIVKDDRLLYLLGKEIARQCRLIGVHWNLAPVIDLRKTTNFMINTRSFGSNKHTVAKKGVAFMLGLQDGGVLACAKHFIALGSTHENKNNQFPVYKENFNQLCDHDLYPFKALIKAKVASIMVGNLQVPCIDDNPKYPISLSKNAISTLLKSFLKFEGLILTDFLNKPELQHLPSGELEVHALIAGNDLLLASRNIAISFSSIKKALNKGLLTHKQIEEKVLKILSAKQKLGLQKRRCVFEGISPEVLNTPYAKKLKSDLLTDIILQHSVQPLSSKELNEKCAVIAINPSKDNMVCQFFNHFYPNVPLFYLQSDNTLSTYSRLLENIAPYEHLIISVHAEDHDSEGKTCLGLSKGLLKIINQLQRKKENHTILLFGSTQMLDHLRDHSNIMICYENSHIAQNIAINLLIKKE